MKSKISAKIKKFFREEGKKLSLKQYIRHLLGNAKDVLVTEEKVQTARKYLENKSGKNDQPRSQKRLDVIKAEKTATKLARKSKKSGSSNSTKTEKVKTTKGDK